MRACHWFLRLLLPTPMKRLVRCLLLKRRLGTLARSLFRVAFTCQTVQDFRPCLVPFQQAAENLIMESNIIKNVRTDLFSSFADELGDWLFVILMQGEVCGYRRVIAPKKTYCCPVICAGSCLFCVIVPNRHTALSQRGDLSHTHHLQTLQ